MKMLVGADECTMTGYSINLGPMKKARSVSKGKTTYRIFYVAIISGQ